MTRRGTNISLKSYDDIFTTEEIRQETGEHIVNIPVNQIHEFRNHPFKVLDDEDMRKMVDSIREYGVLVPVMRWYPVIEEDMRQFWLAKMRYRQLSEKWMMIRLLF